MQGPARAVPVLPAVIAGYVRQVPGGRGATRVVPAGPLPASPLLGAVVEGAGVVAWVLAGLAPATTACALSLVSHGTTA
ncbi:hypothetical protein O2W14_17005 [Modestobacter sp. VKM Ac-2986]|uniref:hypothetical protein n=1 Tax=Modestobacter sp. VKM Ac-2986 TaxID=3004140 RepID=UPI0022AB85A4|nr:hypothetical protein [Modestobacter sp. VKM Ac-2986]MCZ2830538.1 hypothetical protein [Modestobacter sp. VKM Ac-2986]